MSMAADVSKFIYSMKTTNIVIAYHIDKGKIGWDISHII